MKKIYKAAFTMVSVIVSLSVICLLVFYYIQDSLIFYPNRNLESENILKANDAFTAIKIDDYSGWLFKNDSSNKTIIYFGGNAQNCASYFVKLLQDDFIKYFEDYNILAIDYPGYGNSLGKPNEKSITEMSKKVYQYIDSNTKMNSEIVVMGYSIGTGVACEVASNYEVNGLILLAPYDNLTNVINTNFPIFYGPMKLLIKNKFNSADKVSNISSQTLIVASTDDEIIDICLSRNLADLFDGGNIKYVELDGLPHSELIYNEDIYKEIDKFLED